jgi:hypothetical protein
MCSLKRENKVKKSKVFPPAEIVITDIYALDFMAVFMTSTYNTCNFLFTVSNWSNYVLL